MKDSAQKILYIGKAKHLKNRLKQYFVPHKDARPQVPFLTAHVHSIDTIVVTNEKEALLLENTLIKKHQPKYNLLLKDDKTFISLMINHKHTWPMIRLVRCKGKLKEDTLHFGPYTNAYAAREVLELLLRLFPLRQCSDEELKRRRRPCLLYAIKRCVAPCVNLCSKEEYQTLVDSAIHFLKGENTQILKELRAEMKKASEALEFEKAAAFLHTINQVENILKTPSHVTRVKGKELDVLGISRKDGEIIIVQLVFREGNLVGSEHYTFGITLQEDEELLSSFLVQHYGSAQSTPSEILVPFPLAEEALLSEILTENHSHKVTVFSSQRGEKKALLALAHKNAEALLTQRLKEKESTETLLLELQETLKLTRYPRHIECFDTSNISGSDLVAAMITFTEGKKDKKNTRLFRIRNIHKGDDYGALHQVLSRRLLRAKEEDCLPDLVIVDGGKGQLNVALDVFKELDIASVDLMALSKEAARHDKGMTSEKIHIPHETHPISLPPISPLLFFLQKIRDEAHTAAIGFHRKRRSKRVIETSLDEIPGIGPVKRTRLLRHFGSVAALKAASPGELAKIKGLSKKDIENIIKLK